MLRLVLVLSLAVRRRLLGSIQLRWDRLCTRCRRDATATAVTSRWRHQNARTHNDVITQRHCRWQHKQYQQHVAGVVGRAGVGGPWKMVQGASVDVRRAADGDVDRGLRGRLSTLSARQCSGHHHHPTGQVKPRNWRVPHAELGRRRLTRWVRQFYPSALAPAVYSSR